VAKASREGRAIGRGRRAIPGSGKGLLGEEDWSALIDRGSFVLNWIILIDLANND
jgi:hypothetical protein